MTSMIAWFAKSRKPGMLGKVMSCISPSHTASCPWTCRFRIIDDFSVFDRCKASVSRP